MTITDAITTPVVGARPQRSSGLLRAGGASALVAAVANALVAAGARVADVPLEIEGEQIPAVGFAMMTLMFSAAGLLVAAAIRRWAPAPRATFTWIAMAVVALSFVPSLTADTDTATKVVLVATHVVAAAIVVPVVARSLGAATEGAR
jgi:hypothetical protein